MLNDNSVTVAMATPDMIGIKLIYTHEVCFSLRIIRDKMTVKSGIVALTVNKYLIKSIKTWHALIIAS